MPDVGAALAQLAGDYLRGYGPARIADFAWWSGATNQVAGEALAQHSTVDVGDLLLHTDDEAAFDAVVQVKNTVDLLPKWDAYTMGYAPDGRSRLVHRDNQCRIYVRKGVVAPGQPNMGLPGDGYPVVLIDGEAVGTWNVTLKRGQMWGCSTTWAPRRGAVSMSGSRRRRPSSVGSARRFASRLRPHAATLGGQ